jgi:hypothetical protein
MRNVRANKRRDQFETRGRAMFKVVLTALVGISVTAASAQAFDNFGPDRAAAAFGQYGLQGLAVAGRARADDGVRLFGESEESPVAAPAYTPVCWTEYVTVANGNTLMNSPVTICR